MPFGKRAVPPGQPSPGSESPAQTSGASPQISGPSPQRKILPDAVWEGKSGEMLRHLGMSSDDPSNLVPDANSVNARLERDRARHEAKLAEMNRSIAQRVPGGEMRGFSLLPDSCWNGELGHFLMMRLDLFPYDDWNMILLPADMKTAEALNLPPHPNGNVPAFVTAAERFLRDADAHLRAAVAEADRTHDFGAFSDTLDEIRGKVRGLARAFLGEMDKAWEDR